MPGTNIGIDLGTSSVVICIENRGIVTREPCVIAYDSKDRIISVGKKAYDMIDKTPEGIRIVAPMADGVVSDFTAMKHILQYLLSRACKNMIFKPNAVVCMPSTVTGLEKKTVLDLVVAAGAAKANLIEAPLAAAYGSGIDKDAVKGTMVVDIGAGTTDIAVISMGRIAISRSVKVAGNALDEAIIRQLRRERDMVIGQKSAEYIKKTIGSASLREIELGISAKGKSYITNMPCVFEADSTEVYLAMRPQLENVLESVRQVLEETSPELSADIFDTGITLTGGGAKLRGIDKMFENKLGLKTKIAEIPEDCVAIGCGSIKL